MPEIKEPPPCAVCKTIRYFLLAAVPVLLLVYLKPELDLPAIPIHVFVANGLWIGLVFLVAWKYYWEIWKPKSKKKAKLKDNEQEQQIPLDL